MTILAYITDLFFQAKVSQTAHQVGAQLKIVTSLYKFIPELANKPSMVIVDLNADGINASSLISQIKEKAQDLPVLAYCAHVQKDLMKQAKEAGADHVLPKSKFSEELPKILARYGK